MTDVEEIRRYNMQVIYLVNVIKYKYTKTDSSLALSDTTYVKLV